MTYATPISVAVGPADEIAIGRRFSVSLLQPSDSYRKDRFIPPACERLKRGHPSVSAAVAPNKRVKPTASKSCGKMPALAAATYAPAVGRADSEC
jgi:hypothetical protein